MFVKFKDRNGDDVIINSNQVLCIEQALTQGTVNGRGGEASVQPMIGMSVICFIGGIRLMIKAAMEEAYGAVRRGERAVSVLGDE